MTATDDRRTAKGAVRRDLLVAEARAHLLEVGVERFSVRHVADAAGVSLGNLQYYFRSRHDLLGAVVRAEIDADTELVRSLANDDPVEELAAVVTALLGRWSGDRNSVYVALVLVARSSAEFADLAMEIWGRAYDAVGDVLRRIDPQLAPGEIRARAMVIVSLVDGAALQHYATRGRHSRHRIGLDIIDVAVAVGTGLIAPRTPSLASPKVAAGEARDPRVGVL